MNYVVPTNDCLSIPRPPGCTVLAFDFRGRCLGLVLGLRDGQNRIIPDWMTKSASTAELWTGWVFEIKAVEELTFRWIFG